MYTHLGLLHLTPSFTNAPAKNAGAAAGGFEELQVPGGAVGEARAGFFFFGDLPGSRSPS